MSEDPTWTVRHHGINLHEVSVSVSGARAGQRMFSALCLSDLHLDSKGSRRDIIKRLLDEAREQNSPVLMNGDVLDIMQSRNDPRRHSGDKLAKFEVPNYIDAVIDDAADFLEPYADLLVMTGWGNHESAQLKQLGTDTMERLCHELRNRVEGCNVRKGGYSGWVKWRFELGSQKHALNMHYYHGTGGAAPVTQGVIHSQRNSRRLPDAQIVWTGHVHTEWEMTWSRWRLSPQMVLYKDEQLHFCTPGFQDGLGDGSGGWAVEKGNDPRPIGGAWLDFVYEHDTDVEVGRSTDNKRVCRRGVRAERRRAK